jgi:hypothetical protein
MNETGSLLYADEAVRFIEQIEDPVTRNLVNLVFVQMVRGAHLTRQHRPRTDVDALYLVKTLRDFFSQRDVLTRTLEGETVGAWSDDQP